MQGSPEGRGATGQNASEDTDVSGARRFEEDRQGPTWRGWVLSILVAIVLSVTATLLLGGAGSSRSDRAAVSGAAGTGGSCCSPAEAGK